jgi:alkaline phosphatase D
MIRAPVRRNPLMHALLRPAALLVAVLALGGIPAAPAADVRPAATVMHGFADMTSMTLWVQTERAGRIVVELRREDGTARRRIEAATREEDDLVAHVRLAGLDPGTRYRYDLRVEGRPATIAGAFATQPHWQFRTEPPELAIAFGSCFYLNDRFDRPGAPYGGQYGILDAIAAKSPQLMLWLGDNAYYREPEWTSAEAMSARWRQHRAMPEMQRLLRGTSHVAIWDDHDYGPNDSDASFVMKGAALEVFKRYWPNPSFGLPGVPGVFGMVTLGDVDIFLLDDRFHRYPNRYPPTPEKSMFGAAQFEWLKQALVASRAPIKLVAAGGQFWNRANRFEGLHQFPAEQQALASWLLEQKISGVIFLSGDRHLGGLWRIERAGTYPLHEFTSSPLTAGAFANPPQEERDNPDLAPDTLLTQRNFGMIRVSGPRDARMVTLEAYAADGTLLWQRRIAAASLR